MPQDVWEALINQVHDEVQEQRKADGRPPYPFPKRREGEAITLYRPDFSTLIRVVLSEGEESMKTAKQLSKRPPEILGALSSPKGAQELARELKIPASSIHYYLNTMKQKGLITKGDDEKWHRGQSTAAVPSKPKKQIRVAPALQKPATQLLGPPDITQTCRNLIHSLVDIDLGYIRLNEAERAALKTLSTELERRLAQIDAKIKRAQELIAANESKGEAAPTPKSSEAQPEVETPGIAAD